MEEPYNKNLAFPIPIAFHQQRSDPIQDPTTTLEHLVIPIRPMAHGT